MADYDEAELTERERLAGERQKEIAGYSDNTLTGVAKYNIGTAKNIADWTNAQRQNIANKNALRTTRDARTSARDDVTQLKQTISDYDFANKQNKRLRNTQFKQTSRKSEAERFEAQRNLRNAALGLFGSMNQAMNGSTLGNVMSMLRDRNDAENSQYWATLQDNRNAIQNAYDEAYNQNQVAKRTAATNTLDLLRDTQRNLSNELNNIDIGLYTDLVNNRGDLLTNIGNIKGDLRANRRNLQADLAANLNNINPNLYEAPANLATQNTGGQIGYAGFTAEQTDRNYRRLQDQGRGDTRGYTVPKSLRNINYDSVYKAPGTDQSIKNRQSTVSSMRKSIQANQPTLLNYIMPANAEQRVVNRRNEVGGNDYFSRLMNGFN